MGCRHHISVMSEDWGIVVGWSGAEGPRQASESRLRVLGEARRGAGKLQGFRYSPPPNESLGQEEEALGGLFLAASLCR